MKQYYNTNRIDGNELSAAVQKNTRQQDLVHEFFKRNPGGLYATYQVREYVMPGAPHTSAQRAITNLTDLGILEKTTNMVPGPYGTQVHTWRLKVKKGQLRLF